MDKFDKVMLEALAADREPEIWNPPKWIWNALVAMKVAALACLLVVVAYIFFGN